MKWKQNDLYFSKLFAFRNLKMVAPINILHPFTMRPLKKLGHQLP